MSQNSIRSWPDHRPVMALAVLMIPLITGCSHFHSSMGMFCAPYGQLKGQCRTERRARAAAKDAWDCKFAQCHRNHCDPKGLREGFIDGFVDASMGGGGCPPMFAPDQNGLFCHGKKSCSTAWHNGYPMGEAHALSCGFTELPCSRVHPCLRDMERPVNPGCIRVSEYNAYGGSGNTGGIQEFYPAQQVPEQLIPELPPAMPSAEVDVEPVPLQLELQVPPIPAPPVKHEAISFKSTLTDRLVRLQSAEPESEIESVEVKSPVKTPQDLEVRPNVKVLTSDTSTTAGDKFALLRKSRSESSIAGMLMSRTSDGNWSLLSGFED